MEKKAEDFNGGLTKFCNKRDNRDKNRNLDVTSLNDCNGIRTDNHLVRNRTFNHLAEMVECSFTNYVVVSSKIMLQSIKLQILSFEQGVPGHSGNYRVYIHSKRVRYMIKPYSYLFKLQKRPFKQQR